MIVDVEHFGTEEDPAEASIKLVPAGQLQLWMIVLDEQTGELHPVVGEPLARLEDAPLGRYERWVDVTLHDVEQPLSEPAAARVPVVFGADPETLQPMPPLDLLTVEDEALAVNGMCHHRIDPAVEDDQHEEEPLPVWCGRPSDADSPLRFCTSHHEHRQQDSDVLTGRGYAPIYQATPLT